MGRGRNKIQSSRLVDSYELDFSPAAIRRIRVKNEIEISPRTLRLLNEESALVYVKKGGGARRNVKFEQLLRGVRDTQVKKKKIKKARVEFDISKA